jgi:hypothetical protein
LHQTGGLITETEEPTTLQPTNLQSSLCRSENKTKSQEHKTVVADLLHHSRINITIFYSQRAVLVARML